MDNKQIDFYLARAERSFKGRAAGQVIKDIRAIVGPGNMPSDEMGELAEQALEALRNMQRPSAKQLGALEVVIRLMRPVPLSFRGELKDIDIKIKPDYKHWESFRENVKPFMYSIGRIEVYGGDALGTGFLVSNNLFVTNRHVLDQISNGTQVLEKGQAFINFGYELGVNEIDENHCDITGVKAVHDTLDITLLAIDNRNAVPLPVEDAPRERGEQIVTIGYPFKDSRNPLFVQALYENKFGVKRAALGEITQISDKSLFHDCSTLGGNSGSPIFSMETARVVGVHRDGFFLYRNEAVDGAALNSFLKQYV